MFESNYRIEARTTGEVMEFETFKAAYKRLTWLRKTEGEKWPYIITNINTGDEHDFLVERENEDKDHMANLGYTWDMVMRELELVDDSKMYTRLWVNLWNFAYNMFRAAR